MAVSFLSIEETSSIDGLSIGFSWTHSSAICRHLINLQEENVSSSDGSMISMPLSSFHSSYRRIGSVRSDNKLSRHWSKLLAKMLKFSLDLSTSLFRAHAIINNLDDLSSLGFEQERFKEDDADLMSPSSVTAGPVAGAPMEFSFGTPLFEEDTHVVHVIARVGRNPAEVELPAIAESVEYSASPPPMDSKVVIDGFFCFTVSVKAENTRSYEEGIDRMQI
ncbi:hypothetical protein SADUNF_Sadunf18G0090000 [Salix dunnii]|uniref:Uncharacterized protein n=1 Tax=Salix dunnii TaxID=1413687 RepID=A0A835MDU5_9ROSI|nr:hypothetical protein SADUNF_Sadunf18G0090000 [Salix dunnii]